MEDRIIIGALLSLILVSHVFCYHVAAVQRERKAYVGRFIKQVEAAYWQGFDDGQRLEKFKRQARGDE